MRVDRFLEAKFPGALVLPYPARHPQRRAAGQRQAGRRQGSAAGRAISSIPPLRLDARPTRGSAEDEKTRVFLRSITLYEDPDVLVLNKPMGLAVQGGSGMVSTVNSMLDSLRDSEDQRPRLRAPARSRYVGLPACRQDPLRRVRAGQDLRTRAARKIYWALVAGVPKPKQGRISTFLAKDEREDESVMRIARHGEEGAGRPTPSPIMRWWRRPPSGWRSCRSTR